MASKTKVTPQKEEIWLEKEGAFVNLKNQQALATTTGIRHREDNSAHFWLVYVFTQTRVNRDRMKPSFSLSASSAEAVHI